MEKKKSTNGLPGRRELSARGECACPRCDRTFVCGIEAGQEKCWCEELPPLPVEHNIKGCYCPDCLPAMIERFSSPT